MTYVIKFLNVRGKYSTYPPNKGRIWGMNSEAFEKGFIRAEKNKNPIKIKNKDGFISKALITVRNIPRLQNLYPQLRNYLRIMGTIVSLPAQTRS